MNKLVVAFMLFFLVNVLLSAVMEGGGGIATTRLTANLTDVATTVNVANTSGFLRSGYVTVDSEDIRYTSITATTLTGCSRAYNGTGAVAHNVGTRVYSPESSVINSALGFNVASTGATVGSINMMVAVSSFFFTTMPMLITWDFAHFRYSEWGQLLRYVFLAISTGFLIYMMYHLLSALGGVAQSIFVRA